MIKNLYRLHASRIRAQYHYIIFQEMNRILVIEDAVAWAYFLDPTTLKELSGSNSMKLNYSNQFYNSTNEDQ